MNKPHIEVVRSYNPELAGEIGALMPALSARLTREPIAEAHLREIITSPYHDQLTARVEGLLVGAATMSLALGVANNNRKAWLEDFVVSDEERFRGTGIGFELWKGIIGWCRDKRASKLEFTSKPTREAAHRFYLRQGAVIKDTSPFSVDIPS